MRTQHWNQKSRHLALNLQRYLFQSHSRFPTNKSGIRHQPIKTCKSDSIHDFQKTGTSSDLEDDRYLESFDPASSFVLRAGDGNQHFMFINEYEQNAHPRFPYMDTNPYENGSNYAIVQIENQDLEPLPPSHYV